MEKQTYISSRQVIAVLIISNLLFCTAFFPALKAENSIQDVLVAVPVNFVLNFITAIPILVILRRHPGKNLLECAVNILGRAAGTVIGIFYMLCFVGIAVLTQSRFHIYFSNAIIPESTFLAIAVPMFIVCFYGAVKGMEAIARFGGFTLIVYLITLAFLFFSLVPSVTPGFLFPLFYNGPQIFLKAVLHGFNFNIQILYLAFCASFLKSGTDLRKLFNKWNGISTALVLLLELGTVSIMGAFSAKQNFPLQTLAEQSKIGVFDRIDTLDMVAWILNTILVTSFLVYLASLCVTVMGLNKFRKTVILLLCVAIFTVTGMTTRKFIEIRDFTLTPAATIITVTAEIGIPVLILAWDIIRGRVKRNEENG